MEMRLLIISTVDFNKSGIPIAILNNYRRFDHNTMHCTFVTNDSVDGEFEKEIKTFGDEIFVLPNRKKQTIKYIKELHKIAQSKNFDIAHIHGNSATMLFELLALKGTCRIICQAHTTGGIHLFINRMLHPLFISMTEFRAACSEEAGKFLFGEHTFKVLDNGIDSEKYLYNREIKEELRKKNNISNEKILLHVGSFCNRKNQAFLIDVFEQVVKMNPNVILWLVGVGPNMGNIKKIVETKKLENKVRFIGSVNDVWDYMIASDCFVLPSTVESFGIVNIEAQAAGLPCLISDVVPQKVKLMKTVEFISLNESALVWAQKLITMLDYDLSDNERKLANAIIEKSEYNTKKTSKRLQDYYLSVLDK